jgi:hypothetical protein
MDLLLQQPSNQDRFQQILPLLQQQGALSALNNRGQGGGLSNYSGNVPAGRGIFFNDQVDVLDPNDPRLVTRSGVTLARPAMRSLTDVLNQYGYGGDAGGGYRSTAEQSALVASKPGLAAPVGSSYHQEGLAIDLASALQNPKFARLMQQAGWNQFNSSLEPWHWSYGVTG